jgi:lipoprotein-anchoring transpeptidase ErfK/SrfK
VLPQQSGRSTNDVFGTHKEVLTAQVGASHTTPAPPPSPGGKRRRHRSRSGRSPSALRVSWARRRTNEPWTIGTNVSSGCIRLTNEDIVDLYNRTPIGAKVIVFATNKPTAAGQ